LIRGDGVLFITPTIGPDPNGPPTSC
jgi:hypothetical protein